MSFVISARGIGGLVVWREKSLCFSSIKGYPFKDIREQYYDIKYHTPN
jgi:hypothetical protein